jgi:hypothetical protein
MARWYSFSGILDNNLDFGVIACQGKLGLVETNEIVKDLYPAGPNQRPWRC